MRKTWIAAAMAAIVCSSAAHAATVDTSAGTQGLVFQFSGLSDLGVSSYNAGVVPSLDLDGPFADLDNPGLFGIGFKHYLSDMLAIRPSLEFGIASKKEDGEENETDEKKTLTSIGLSAVLEKHMPSPAAPVSPFLGVGAGFGVAQAKVEPHTPSGDEVLESKRSATSFAAFGVAGFEVAVMDGVNLGGEYRLGFKATSHSHEQERLQGPDEKDDGSSFTLGFASASLFANIAWQ